MFGNDFIAELNDLRRIQRFFPCGGRAVNRICNKAAEQPDDADGDANRAVASPDEAAELTGRDVASIWYRHGWTGRMRLTRRPPGLRRVIWSAGGMLALGILSVAASIVLYFLRG